PTVVVFYRGGWCPYCNTQLSGLAGVEERLSELGFQIVALSPDSPQQVAAALEESEFSYRLLSDASANAAKGFGVAFKVDEETYQRLQGFGIDLEAASGESHRILPVPAVFILNTEGEVVFRYYDADYRERLSEERLIEAAEGVW
ncbi:MAG: AhpC/TSA family protein, partial [Opitutales bacterium]|nr:AhpC/TSA family protein [Opitutales bacterium]